MKTNIHFLSYLAHFFLEFGQICRGNQNTHFVFSNFLVSKIMQFFRYVGEYCTAGQATDGNMAPAYCMLDT